MFMLYTSLFIDDHSRVKLRDVNSEDVGADYINANYIDVSSNLIEILKYVNHNYQLFLIESMEFFHISTACG